MKSSEIDTGHDEMNRLAAAQDWLERLDHTNLDEDDMMRWLAWCDADPANREAFERMQEVSQLSRELVHEVKNGELIRPHTRNELQDRLGYLQRNWLSAVSLATAAVIILSVVLMWPRSQEPMRVPKQFANHEQLLVRDNVLADGSELKLAPKSVVVVNYAAQKRAVRLERGEAFFAVAPDPGRPFVVDAGSTQIRAVGTAFNVRRIDDRVVVAVAEGQVKIFQSKNETGGILASAGSQISWGGADENPVVEAIAPEHILSWRDGLLRYTNEPLTAVIADVNRYSDTVLAFRGEGLEDMRYSGLIRVERIEEWVHALPSVFPVEIRIEEDTTYLQTRHASN